MEKDFLRVADQVKIKSNSVGGGVSSAILGQPGAINRIPATTKRKITMIKKLELPTGVRLACGIDCDIDFKPIEQTVNQLVDAVNELQATISKMEIVEIPAENSLTDKDYITITADDVLVGGESVREYNGEKIYNYYHLPAYFKEVRDEVAKQGIKLLEIHCLQSSTDGEYAKTGNPTPDKNGCFTWCRCVWEQDGKKRIGAWVFDYTFSSAAYCANLCANDCAFGVRSNAGFRAAVFGLQD